MTPHAADPAGPVLRAQLPANLTAPRQARAAIRHALNSWGLDVLASDAQLLASELVANAAEHADGTPIGLTIRAHQTPGGHHGITCEITDTSPRLPQAKPARPEDERGRGLSIVTALATATGITTSPHGKTTWFTLATPDHAPRTARHADLETELEAGA